jgi:hypothetical protein
MEAPSSWGISGDTTHQPDERQAPFAFYSTALRMKFKICLIVNGENATFVIVRRL